MARSMETMSRSKIIPAGWKARTAGGESGGGGDRNRTDVSRFCRPLPYRLATPPLDLLGALIVHDLATVGRPEVASPLPEVPLGHVGVPLGEPHGRVSE